MKRVIIAVALILLSIVFLYILLYNNVSMVGNVTGPAEKSLVLVKFYQNPDIREATYFEKLKEGLKVVTKFTSVNNLNKNNEAEDFKQLFKGKKNLENTYEIKIKGDASSFIESLKNDANVEYARISETNFENKIKNEIDKINKENQDWEAGYTLQSIYTDEDKKMLAGELDEAKGNTGKGGGKSGKTSCTDSDTGKDFLVSGITCLGTDCKNDSCSGSTLTEYYCQRNQRYSVFVSCGAAGCSNGACNPACNPSCSGKTCGDIDGCGGICTTGTCPSGSSCANGVCVSSNLPLSLDWRNRHGKNYVTSVRNQGSCGSCWAFGVTAVVESSISAYFNNASKQDLSEQDLVSCSGAGSCSGGYISNSLSYIKSSGEALESCFSYTATNNLCTNKCTGWENNAWKISGYTAVPATDEAIKKAVYEHGPLVTAFDVYSDFYYYSSGIYNRTSTTYKGGHAVSIVGYGYYNDALYWIVKNSWGSGWGESGFFKIYAGTSGIGRSTYYINSPLSLETSEAKICEDNDLDGYCNWGLGSKPSNCPACSNLPDCDDSNPAVLSNCL